MLGTLEAVMGCSKEHTSALTTGQHVAQGRPLLGSPRAKHCMRTQREGGGSREGSQEVANGV